MSEIDFEPLALFAELKAKAAAERQPAELPDRLPLNDIQRLPVLFQPRCSGEDERHLSELVRAIKVHGLLDPIEVFQVGGEAFLIDGHHRYSAYELAEVSEPVPVIYFKGTVDEAVLKAGQANNKVKLPMTTRERMDYAWKLVRMGLFSKRQIVEASGVADRQIGNMRKVSKTLGEEALGIDRWMQAMRIANNREGREMSAEERADWVEQRAQQLADKLQRTFGTKLTENPEITARGLEICLGRRLEEIMEAMGFCRPDDEGDEFGFTPPDPDDDYESDF